MFKKKKTNVIHVNFKDKRQRNPLFKAFTNIRLLQYLLAFYIVLFITSVIILIEVSK